MDKGNLAVRVADATVAAGAIHVGLGTVKQRAEIARWARRGGWNAVQPADKEAQAALWFIVAGAGLVTGGLVARDAARRSGSLPAVFGLGMLATAAAIALLQPKSGAWGLIVLAVGALAAGGAR